MTRQERSIDSRQQVLDTAKRQLWQGDDSKFRIADISSETGLSSTVIYTYFRSRQGLIDAAYIEIFRETSLTILKSFEATCSKSSSLNELMLNLTTKYLSFAEGDLDLRLMRIRVVGAATARKKMMKEFIVHQNEYFTDLSSVFEKLQKRKIISTKFSPRELATISDGLAMMLGVLEETAHPGDVAGLPKLITLIYSA